jgi:hypothetical protein
VPGTKHRDEVLAALPEEQRPIADQLVAGGLAAVRQALAQAKAAQPSADTSNNAAILALAEQMLPSIKEAIWLDRAEAAVENLDHLSLRELRTTVTGALPRDEHGRELDRTLRNALEERVKKLRDGWHDDMQRALEEGRVLQALRLSARPPEPAARFPADLVGKLSDAAGAAMAADTPAERWMALLEAATASPIRRYIKPAGIPAGADETLLKAAGQAAGRIPALAPLLGMPMPPPPGPAAGGPAPTAGQRRPASAPPRPRPARPAGTKPPVEAKAAMPAEAPAQAEADAESVATSATAETPAKAEGEAPEAAAAPPAVEPAKAEGEAPEAAAAPPAAEPPAAEPAEAEKALGVENGVSPEEVREPVNQG